MNTEQKTVNFIDSTYLIPEMVGELDDGITNFNKIIDQQTFILEVVEKDERSKDKLKGFSEGLTNQIKDMTKKVEINKYRQQCLENALNVAKDNINVRFALTMLLEGLGIVNREAVPYEERAKEMTEDAKK